MRNNFICVSSYNDLKNDTQMKNKKNWIQKIFFCHSLNQNKFKQDSGYFLKVIGLKIVKPL